MAIIRLAIKSYLTKTVTLGEIIVGLNLEFGVSLRFERKPITCRTLATTRTRQSKPILSGNTCLHL